MLSSVSRETLAMRPITSGMEAIGVKNLPLDTGD
jgi:hypothetical protein